MSDFDRTTVVVPTGMGYIPMSRVQCCALYSLASIAGSAFADSRDFWQVVMMQYEVV